MIHALANSLGIGSYLVKMITIFWVEWVYVSEEFVAFDITYHLYAQIHFFFEGTYGNYRVWFAV